MKRQNVGYTIQLLEQAYDPLGMAVNAFDNDTLHVDFKPLFECIHIYTALESLDELQKSYQADRKARIFRLD
jgi:hypothetical protein